MINSPTVVGEAGAKLYIPTPEDYAQLDAWRAEVGCSQHPEKEDTYTIIPKYNIMNNYPRLPSWSVIGNYVNCVGNIYYLVFKPKNKKYDPKKNLMDHVRKKCGKHSAIIITREIEAAKVHYNVLVRTTEDLSKLHDTQDSRFYIYCKEVPHKAADLNKVHEYIVKESKTRYFTDNKDIYVFFKKRYKINKSIPYDLDYEYKKSLASTRVCARSAE